MSCQSDFVVFEVGYSNVDLGHQIPDLSRVCRLRVDYFWRRWGWGNDGAFALEGGGVGGFIVDSRGLRVDRAPLRKEGGRLILDRGIEGFE